MHISIQITPSIIANIYPQPKKSRSDSKRYDLYLKFSISEYGINQFITVISTGLTVSIVDWGNKEMKGRGEKATGINTQLNGYVNDAKFQLENFRSSDVSTCSQVRDFINTSIKTKITGKAPKGKKDQLTKELNERTLDAVLEALIHYRDISQERARIYQHSLSILHRFFKETKGSTPLITNISERDLMNFQVWYKRNYRLTSGKRIGLAPTQNSTATWFTQIAAVFKFAQKPLKVIKDLPLPEKFRGSFVGSDKNVLEGDDYLRLMQLQDHQISQPQLVAKYCLILGLSTGMAMVDIKALKEEHVKRDKEINRLRIRKIREKHLNNPNITNPEPFRVVLTATAEHAFYKLRELAGGEETLFKLTCDANLNKHYKNLMKMAGISVHTTHYVLRHSFAVDYMDHDGRLEDLGKILGNDIRSTQIYGKVSEKRLAEKATQLEQKSKIHQLPVPKINGRSNQLQVS